MKKYAGIAILFAIIHTPMAFSAQSTGDWRGFGSHYTLTSWTEKDGLAIVRSIAQDQQGVIWLGTAAGLVRFDGARFVPWTTPSRSTRLPSTLIPALCAARDGSLWVAFSGSPRVGRIQGNKFVEYGSGDGLQISTVEALLQVRDGGIWAGGRGGLARFQNERWEVVPWPFEGTEPTVESLFEDHANNLWIGTSNGMFRRAAATGSIVAISQTSDSDIMGITEDRSQRIWITGPRNGVQLLKGSGDANHVVPYSPPARGERLLSDANGSIWIATLGKGVLRIDDIEDQEQGAKTEEFTMGAGLAGDVVRSIFQDRDGAIWAGTVTGLTRISHAEISTVVGRSPTAEAAVGAVTIAPDFSVWGAISNDLVRFSADGGTSRPSIPKGTGAIEALYADPRGVIWIGSDQGLSRYEDGKVVGVSLPNVSLKRVRAITTDAKNGLWLSDHYGGLIRWHDGQVTSFKNIQGIIACLYTDKRGRIWVGNSEGDLEVYEDGQFRSYSDKNGLGGGSVMAVSEDTRGTVWVATMGGITKFSDASATFVPVAQLVGSPLRWMVLDRDDHLWLGTVQGIVRFEQSEFAKAAADPAYRPVYRFFDASDGLKGSPGFFGYPNATRSADGLLWFVTSSGLSVLNPDQLTPVHQAPPIQIDGLTADGFRVERSDGVALASHTSRLQFDYTAIAFGSQGKLRFRYMLDGFERKWVDNGSNRAAYFTSLSPGRYQFRVQARYDDGSWSEPGAAVRFSIEPAFYQTYWFYAASTSAMFFLVWAGWQTRVRHIRQQFALVLKERARLGHEIHDTLLQTLVGTALQLDHLAGGTAAPPVVRSRLQRIRRQLEDSIEEANQSIRDLQSAATESDLPALLEQSVRTLVDDAAALEFSVEGTVRSCSPAVKQQVRRIAQEAVTNAVRHAKPTRIVVQLTYEDKGVQLKVSDNGCGFSGSPSTQGAHWGLSIMSERAQQVGGTVNISSAVGSGTTVVASIPYSNPS